MSALQWTETKPDFWEVAVVPPVRCSVERVPPYGLWRLSMRGSAFSVLLIANDDYRTREEAQAAAEAIVPQVWAGLMAIRCVALRQAPTDDTRAELQATHAELLRLLPAPPASPAEVEAELARANSDLEIIRERMLRLAVERERERCARACERLARELEGRTNGPLSAPAVRMAERCAEVIREGAG